MMAERIVVYSKQENGEMMPLTMRVEWLPTGVIKPRMYWTPDGSCFQVTHVIECVRLAHLKSGGKGIRFKVMAMMIESEDIGAEPSPVSYEIYLYLADDFFCAANMIDEQYAHDGKVYIPVTMDIFPGGDYELICFWVRGVCYCVDRTYDVTLGGSYEAGGVGLRHGVMATMVKDAGGDAVNATKLSSRKASLYLELNKWFVKSCKNAVPLFHC